MRITVRGALVLAAWLAVLAAGSDARGQSLNGPRVIAGGSAGWSAAAPMPSARDYLAAAVAPGGTIYAFGGYGADGRPVNTVEAYRPGSNTWTARAPMPKSRAAPAATTGSNGKIYVIGGLDAQRHALATVSQAARTPGGCVDHPACG